MEIENFEIIRTLGVGATAEVFLARNLQTDTNVALKCLTPLLNQDHEALQRFLTEVEILESLDHPNIVRLLGKRTSGGRVALELEFVDGVHLGRWLQLPTCSLYEPKLWLLVQIARGLGAAHERGVIHRDLKPENILISKDGHIKITDFGLAKELGRMTMTRMGLLVGSLGYMAPELVNGEKATMGADNFSFGAIAYEILSGRPAFVGETPQSLLKSVVDKRVEPLNALCPYLPLRICELIEGCLEKDPRDRPGSIWQISGEIMDVLGNTRMSPLCQALVAQQVSPTSALVPLEKKALRLKHKALMERKSSLTLGRGIIERGPIISLANEFQKYFPDDPVASDFLTILEPQKRSQEMTRKVAGLVGVTLLVGFTWWLFQNQWKIPVFQKGAVVAPSGKAVGTKPSIPKLESSADKVARKNRGEATGVSARGSKFAKSKLMPLSGALPVRRKKAPISRAVVPPQKKRGTLQFFVDEGVTVFVDEVLVPYEELNNFKLLAGKHGVKLVKPGFLPILNQVFVRPNRVTQVRAKGGL